MSFSISSSQQDAVYDHEHSLAYNNVAACCHSDYWTNDFHRGYETQWNCNHKTCNHKIGTQHNFCDHKWCIVSKFTRDNGPLVVLYCLDWCYSGLDCWRLAPLHEVRSVSQLLPHLTFLLLS